jgi:hypothetical protein
MLVVERMVTMLLHTDMVTAVVAAVLVLLV